MLTILQVKFNQDLSNWYVKDVKSFKGMFRNCRKFNQDLSKWDMSRADNISYMFQGCNSFKKNLGWKVSIYIDDTGAFDYCGRTYYEYR